MTTTQIEAMRNLWTAASSTPKTMTAVEMAFARHNLNRAGDKATMIETGEVWYWAPSIEMWTR